MDEENDSSQSPDDKLLKEIRERYIYLKECWEDSRKERGIDMRYILGDPWDDKDRKAREDVGRPCVNHDELRQYVNQAINNIRQNKRGIKVDPDGKGADDKTAELHQDLIRTIEYKCGATNTYISSGFEPALRGSYGFFRISRRYVGKSFEQEIVIKPIMNPDSVLFDWDCKEADWSDAKDCFVLDWITKDEFRHKYPNATIRSFSADEIKDASEWIQADKLLVAEYWKVESKFSKLYQLEDGRVVDKKPEEVKAIAERDEEEKTLIQYITNGVEILKKIPQPAEIIPIIPVIGEEIWIDEGDGAKRVLLSLVRIARDPQMSLAYLCSQETEEAGLSPRVSYVGYKGQFESDMTAWEESHKVPHPMLQIDPVVDGTSNVLPLPRREAFVPNFAAYEVAKDSCRRAIQAAMGISPLPTAMQRDNQKSGVALERIQQSQAVGSFHFVDNFDRALRLAGRVIESWIPVVYDSEREMMLRRADDTFYRAKLNTEAPYIDEKNQERFFKTDMGEHHITISSGPNYQSQMDAVSQFLDLLISNLANLPVAPPQQAKLLSMAIKMKQMGPKGDEMADIISPPEKEESQQLPPQVMQEIEKLQQQLAAMNEYAKKKEAEIAEMKQAIDAKVIDNEYRKQIEKMKIEKDLGVAEINTKAQQLSERLALLEDLMKKLYMGQPAEQPSAAQ